MGVSVITSNSIIEIVYGDYLRSVSKINLGYLECLLIHTKICTNMRIIFS